MINTKAYIEKHLKIADKKGRIIPFKLNRPQNKLYEAIRGQYMQGKPVRIVILKARQMGFSTLTEGIIFKEVCTNTNTRAGIVAHVEDATTNLFNMSKRYYEYLPEPIQPRIKASNAKELVFEDLESSIKCYTAGGKGIGRSATFRLLHVSEYAFWQGEKEKTLLGLMQAVPNDPDTVVIIESTANGFEDFKKIWDMAERGESEFVPVFCAWWELPEYSMPYDGFALTAEEKDIKKRYGLTNGQIAWRRWSIANNCGGDPDLFRQEYPANPYEAFISTGKSVFDTDAVSRRLEQLKPPVKRGQFEYKIRYVEDEAEVYDIRWVDDPDGYIQIFDDVKPYWPYVIGGDTADGGSDKFIGQVLDNTTGAQVAILRHQFDEDLYAHQMYCLGMYYNKALVGVEINYSTHPVKELQRIGYPNQYFRETIDSISKKPQRKFGFNTTKASRPAAVAELVTYAREHIELINDAETLKEMLTFVRDEQGKPCAVQGEHDDCVMALAIAHFIRPQQDYKAHPPKERKPDFFRDTAPKMADPLGRGQVIKPF